MRQDTQSPAEAEVGDRGGYGVYGFWPNPAVQRNVPPETGSNVQPETDLDSSRGSSNDSEVTLRLDGERPRKRLRRWCSSSSSESPGGTYLKCSLGGFEIKFVRHRNGAPNYGVNGEPGYEPTEDVPGVRSMWPRAQAYWRVDPSTTSTTTSAPDVTGSAEGDVVVEPTACADLKDISGVPGLNADLKDISGVPGLNGVPENDGMMVATEETSAAVCENPCDR